MAARRSRRADAEAEGRERRPSRRRRLGDRPTNSGVEGGAERPTPGPRAAARGDATWGDGEGGGSPAAAGRPAWEHEPFRKLRINFLSCYHVCNLW